MAKIHATTQLITPAKTGKSGGIKRLDQVPNSKIQKCRVMKQSTINIICHKIQCII